jgi:hypothetical protein
LLVQQKAKLIHTLQDALLGKSVYHNRPGGNLS